MRPRPAAAPAVAVAVAALLSALLGACGVPLDTGDRPVGGDRIAVVPEDTTPPATTTTTVAPGSLAVTSTAPPAYVVDMYWVQGERLARVPVRLSAEPDLLTVLGVLRTGPDARSAQDGLRSALPGTELIRSATARGGTATVELDAAFLTLPGTEQVFAFAQIVFAVTGVPGVGQVVFQIDGVPIVVPSADGRPLVTPVSRDDYASLTTPTFADIATTSTTVASGVPGLP